MILDIMNKEKVQKGLDFLKEDEANALAELIELVVIEAPTGHEEKRAAEMERRFKALGLADVKIDKHGNVIGIKKGKNNGPTILIDAHLDTVFPFGTVTEAPKIEHGVIRCPGIGDDTRGLSVILSVARAFNASPIELDGDLIFIATAREEGMGCLGGITDFLEDNTDISACINVDGGGFSNILYTGTGLYTKKFTFKGQGGHSYSAFGTIAQSLHAAGRAISKIADLQVEQDPKSTFAVTSINAGNLEGLHAIPEEVSFIVNYRANTTQELERLDAEVENAIKLACEEETNRWNKDPITFETKTICYAPVAEQRVDTPMIKALDGIIRYLGQEPIYAKGSSTNANIPISKGISAVCIGMSDESYKEHSLDEFIPVKDSYKCQQAVFLLALMSAGAIGICDSILLED